MQALCDARSVFVWQPGEPPWLTTFERTIMKRIVILIALLAGCVGLPVAGASAASPQVVYNAIPLPLPPNVASVGFEATSTAQFGDYVHLGGTARTLNSVTVTMSDWAVYSDYSTDVRYSQNNATWTQPITINVYSSHLGANGAPDTLLATTTQTIVIPWRPAADPTCSPSTDYRASDGQCYGGIAFNATFTMSSPKVTLPNDVIVGVAFNTADYGATPVGKVGPYNSLNVGVPAGQTASVGTDDSANNVFWNTSYGPFYADGGLAGVGIFRQDTDWAPNGTVAFQISASSPTTSLTAAPQLVEFRPFAGIGSQVVQATLTSGGTPVSGATISFSVGSTPLCTATTGLNGVARCTISPSGQARVNQANSYTATFAGNGGYLASSATTPEVVLF
jgi:hypothetical protein